MRKSRGYPGSVRFPSDYATAPLRHPCGTSCFSCLANAMAMRSRKQTAKGQPAHSHPFVSRPSVRSFFLPLARGPVHFFVRSARKRDIASDSRCGNPSAINDAQRSTVTRPAPANVPIGCIFERAESSIRLTLIRAERISSLVARRFAGSACSPPLLEKLTIPPPLLAALFRALRVHGQRTFPKSGSVSRARISRVYGMNENSMVSGARKLPSTA